MRGQPGSLRLEKCEGNPIGLMQNLAGVNMKIIFGILFDSSNCQAAATAAGSGGEQA